ncbi:NAD(P)H-dependent oxidoreductase [Gordonia sp. HY442]|uniref:NADPH-dependent FMN reductase n=1 Tax=Gordonia zhenghanii TaxID=2911516 RepID=UPI001F42F6FC|nr:NAD(P)H-dependent oxidoreductase [Gordonia zhenghanii]MCF8602108.1 NAD(P)H-dependent oxidoreductase [Gordonia zhenghanii]
MKIGIISGSLRNGRATSSVAAYIHRVAAARTGEASYELVELADFDVPLLTSPVHPMVANKSYDDPKVQKWSETIDGFDAFVFVTPEYNHGVPGGFKNAVDSLGAEWVGKPVAFVGHGSVGGVRAIEQWRQIVVNFSMPVARAEVNFNMFNHWDDGTFTPADRHDTEVDTLLDQLEGLTQKTAS